MYRKQFLITTGAALTALSLPMNVKASTEIVKTLPELFLIVDPLPLGNLARYEKDFSIPTTLFTNKNSPVVVIEGEDFLIPTYSRNSFDENKEFIKLLDTAIPQDPNSKTFNHIIEINNQDDIIQSISSGFSKIEQQRYIPDKILVGENFANRLIDSKSIDIVNEESDIKIAHATHFGRLWTSDIYKSDLVESNTAYCITHAMFLGVMPLREKDNEIGMAIVNPLGISKITIK